MLNDNRVRERFQRGIRPGLAPRDAFGRAIAAIDEGGRRPQRRMPLAIAAATAVALAALLVAVLLLGIRQSPTGSTPAGTISAPPTTSVSPTPSEPPVAVPNRPAPTLARCHASDLSGERAAIGAAMGSAYSLYRLTNTSQHSCTMYGFPGLQLLDAQNQPLLTTTRWSDGRLAQPGPVLVRLEPGQQAHFHLAVGTVPDGTKPACVSASKLLVTPPDETTALTITVGIYACANGGLDASAIRAGPGTSDPSS